MGLLDNLLSLLSRDMDLVAKRLGEFLAREELEFRRNRIQQLILGILFRNIRIGELGLVKEKCGIECDWIDKRIDELSRERDVMIEELRNLWRIER